MPQSRKRKKSKKKPQQTKQKLLDREVFDDGVVEFVREGKNIFMRNKLSSEQHVQYIQQLKENRPKAYIELKEKISKVVSLINDYDKIFVLGGISALGSHKNRTDETDDGLSEVTMEYCQSIAVATENINKGKVPSQKVIQDIYDLLVEIRRYFQAYYATEHVEEKYSKMESKLRFHIISETLFIRGEGYLTHIMSLFNEMFSPHDHIFEKYYGFKSRDIIETFQQLESDFTLRVAGPNKEPHPFLVHCINMWDLKNGGTKKYPDDFAIEHQGVAFENGKLMVYPLNWIPYYDKLFKIRQYDDIQKKVVSILSMKFGENEIFTQPKQYEYEVLTLSSIYTKPIVEDDEGNHYLFAMNLGARNYFRIAQNLLQFADPSYYTQSFLGNRIAVAKDVFIEKKVLELFKEMLPDVEFYRGLKYDYPNTNLRIKCASSRDGNYELDILGVSQNATYLVEVKAGLISEQAKRGAIKSIRKDLSEIIGDAVCQSYRAYKYIQDVANPFFITNDGQTVTPTERGNIFRISVSFSYIGDIISSLSRLQELDILDKGAGFAWTVNIFDFIPISKLINSEGEFIDFLSKRIEFYRDERLTHADEIDIFGLYLDNDMKIDEAFKNSSTVMLNGYKNDIDKYFDYGGPKPKKKRPVK